MEMNYEEFLNKKNYKALEHGFKIDDSEVHKILFPFQRDIVKWAVKKGKAAIFADTGLGKTLMQLEWARIIKDKKGGKALILAPLAVSYQTIKEAKKLNLEIHYCRDESEMDDRISITNYERLDKFQNARIDIVVLDECFPPGTCVDVFNIDNVLALRYIEDIKVGDRIYNAIGEDYVRATRKRQINRAIRFVADGRTITSSENHPYFTLHGWKSAKNLQPGDHIVETASAMRLVRDDFQSPLCSREDAEILRTVLLSEMENETTGNCCKGPFSRSCSYEGNKKECMVSGRESQGSEGNGKNHKFKSNEQPGNQGEGFCYAKENEASSYNPGREWSRINNPSRDNAKIFRQGMENRISGFFGEKNPRTTNCVQVRPCPSNEENKYRNRWPISLQPERGRSEERSNIGFARVESIEILEQGHPDLEKYRDADGYIYFYDIEATRHPSFSVNSLLVHNSSILKAFMGKTKRSIIERFKDTPFKLACTATPSPNDHMEILNHCDFLDVMASNKALAIWFINDSMQFGSYRLKKYSVNDFWAWVSSWACSLSKPSDLGYDDDGFILPPLNFHEHIIKADLSKNRGDMLFRIPELNATSFHQEKRMSSFGRADKAREILQSLNGDQTMVWCDTNYDADNLRKLIPGAEEVRGNDSIEKKEKAAIDFVNGEIRTLISKPSIFGFGMNFQNCNQVIYSGLNFSYESFYQSVRRFWRYGQKNPVNVHLIMAETEKNILNILKKKQSKFQEMKTNMNEYMKEFQEISKLRRYKRDYEKRVVEEDGFKMICGDAVEEIKTIPDESVDYILFSPPFSNLYIYSDSLRDMGNNEDDELFFDHFRFIIPDLLRITTSGRLCSIHCKDLVNYKGRDGASGLRDFPGKIIQVMEEAGWQYCSRLTIWKDPVIEMQRTKSHGLLYKQLRKDSSYSRQGLPDYILTFRKWTEAGDLKPINWKTKENFLLDKWQKYASPVWFDIQQTNVLNCRLAREEEDEKHICPLQLDVIERCLELWTNPGDVVFSPFAGIGSEGYMSLKLGRKFLGIELKDKYFEVAVDNLRNANPQKAML